MFLALVRAAAHLLDRLCKLHMHMQKSLHFVRNCVHYVGKLLHFVGKIEYYEGECVHFVRKLVHYMEKCVYFVGKSLQSIHYNYIYFFEELGILNIQNYVCSLKNCIHLIYIELFFFI